MITSIPYIIGRYNRTGVIFNMDVKTDDETNATIVKKFIGW